MKLLEVVRVATQSASRLSLFTSSPIVTSFYRFKFAAFAVTLAPLLVSAVFSSSTLARQKYSPAQAPVAKIQWTKQPGVTKYRLQIATDEKFSDVLFDGLIMGSEYVVRDLAPGRYYWRIAQAQNETGQFGKAIPFDVKLPAMTNPKVAIIKIESSSATPNKTTRNRDAVSGWSVATGEIMKLMAVELRRGTQQDFLGVNSQGTVYALDGAKGIALWTANFKLDAKAGERAKAHYSPFTPLIINSATSSPRTIVAFDKGVRALDGPSGRELWKSDIAGYPVSGLVVDAGRTGGPKVYLIGEKRDKLLVLDGNSGQLEADIKLRDEATGPPLLLPGAQERGLLVPLKGGVVELLALDGSYLKSIRLGSELTTQPVVVQTSRGVLMLAGMKSGLAAFDAASLQPLGRIAIEGADYPVGTLYVADLDGDRIPEVVMTTNSGRVMAVDVAKEKIRWSANISRGATAIAFADLNSDSLLDVVLPGKNSFAIGLSGIDGSVIWDSGEAAPDSIGGDASRGVLAAARVNDGHIMVVGNDRSWFGLRALEVMKSSAKSNLR
jgi:outer membrane protein assembly factor BamB